MYALAFLRKKPAPVKEEVVVSTPFVDTIADFPTYFEKKKGWWREDRATVPCILPKDGQLAVFLLIDVECVLDEHYPFRIRRGQKIWYFNDTLDREIAEAEYGRAICNPQVLWLHFMQEGWNATR